MKIGILTFYWARDNYGQLLQCYALQKYLRDAGHEAFLIRYNWSLDALSTPLWKKAFKALNPVKLYNFIAGKIRAKKLLDEQKQHDRHFDDFRAKYIAFLPTDYAHFSELRENPPECDAYVVGSDQVWNFSWCGKSKAPIHAYFLDFGGEGVKRLSYAASWGVTAISEEYRAEIAPLLSRFDYISVREESGVGLCRECGRSDAEWVCDPTLLLGAETYRAIYRENEIRKPKSKFLLLYMLANKCDFDIQAVYDFAKSKNLSVVYVTGNGVVDNREKYFATIPEWLYLMDNAEYVVTNSFHCGVFSTIFEKKFGIVRLTGGLEGMNARFDSLFALRGTGARYVWDRDFSVLDVPYETKSITPSEKFLQAFFVS